jgi:hypothetical protein
VSIQSTAIALQAATTITLTTPPKPVGSVVINGTPF